jgi:hypothetical protein
MKSTRQKTVKKRARVNGLRELSLLPAAIEEPIMSEELRSEPSQRQRLKGKEETEEPSRMRRGGERKESLLLKRKRSVEHKEGG